MLLPDTDTYRKPIQPDLQFWMGPASGGLLLFEVLPAPVVVFSAGLRARMAAQSPSAAGPWRRPARRSRRGDAGLLLFGAFFFVFVGAGGGFSGTRRAEASAAAGTAPSASPSRRRRRHRRVVHLGGHLRLQRRAERQPVTRVVLFLVHLDPEMHHQPQPPLGLELHLPGNPVGERPPLQGYAPVFEPR